MKSHPIGKWKNDGSGASSSVGALKEALYNVTKACFLVEANGNTAVATDGKAEIGGNVAEGSPLLAFAPELPPENLGDSSFLADFDVDYPIVGGAMYHGITSVELVEAMAKAKMLAFFGTGGLPLQKTEEAICRLKEALGDKTFGCNLLHSPFEPEAEKETVELFIKHGLRTVSASAYTALTLPIVRYRLHGIKKLPDGTVEAPNRVIGKVSRQEVATKFFAPPPENLVKELVQQGLLTEEQANMAKTIPVGQDITAEADSGGHTDNQPFVTMVPTMLALRDQAQKKYGFKMPLRVGVGGGIGTPAAAAASFAMGAAYLVTGSVNQSCVEAGTSRAVREMLAQTQQADVTMAPAADMFEMGVKVQVLKRGTMFPMRAAKLWELYRNCPSIEAIPEKERASLEKSYFKASLDEIWQQTRDYFQQRDPGQVTKAEADSKHKMALVFRWYLGQSSHWATNGEATRKFDYQIQCGPSMGAFNEWTKGTFLETCEERRIVPVSLNLLLGASILTRLQGLRFQGVDLPDEVLAVSPMKPEELARRLNKTIDGLN